MQRDPRTGNAFFVYPNSTFATKLTPAEQVRRKNDGEMTKEPNEMLTDETIQEL
jgi:hypothetical protein